jgi:glycosyltransferase involved in cell wall biosynthesis
MTVTSNRPGTRTSPVARREPTPRVSIIIPAYNEESTIARCVAAALDQTVPAHEIIVVDNRSTDSTAALVARMAAEHPGCGVRLLAQHRVQGLVPSRNAGFEAATGEILGRIDADTVIDRRWVERVGDRLSRGDAGAVTGPVSYYDLPLPRGGLVVDDVARRLVRRLGDRYPFLYGSNMALRATAWRSIRDEVCLDPEDRLHEDIDLSVHLYETGIVAAYDSRMRAGVSARRADTSPSSFRDYTRRFDRTYEAHRVHHWYLGVPRAVLGSVYWPVHFARAIIASVGPAPAVGARVTLQGQGIRGTCAWSAGDSAVIDPRHFGHPAQW